MKAEFSILSFERPGGLTAPIGVLLLDRSGRMVVRCRRDWDHLADREDVEVLSAVADDLVRLGRELGGTKLLDYLEDTLSNAVQITDRQPIEIVDVYDAAERLYHIYVDPGKGSIGS